MENTENNSYTTLNTRNYILTSFKTLLESNKILLNEIDKVCISNKVKSRKQNLEKAKLFSIYTSDILIELIVSLTFSVFPSNLDRNEEFIKERLELFIVAKGYYEESCKILEEYINQVSKISK